MVKRLLPKKILLLLTAGLLFLFSSGQAFAQSEWFAPSKQEHEAMLEECRQGNVGLECTVNAVVAAIANSLSTLGIGVREEPGSPTPKKPGAIHFASGLVSLLLTNPPVSSEEYVQYLAQRLNPAEEAYAQDQELGTGYVALQSFIPIWRAFRDISYLVFVLIFVFIGLMIMFRAHIDPQTVVNVQTALPKLVVTLLLITFSYAIAGFFIDLIYIGIYLTVAVFYSQGLISDAETARSSIINQNLFTLIFSGAIWRFVEDAAKAVDDMIDTAIGPAFLADLLSFLGESIAYLVFSVAILYSVFKLFFILGIAYVQIILATLFAPIMILFNALPGSGSFGNWVRNFLSNALMFPAVAALFIIAAVMQGPTTSGKPDPFAVERQLVQPDDRVWLPPFLGIQYVDAEFVLSLIGFFIVISAPSMATAVQKALKAQPLPVAGVFAPLAAGAAFTGGVARVAGTPIAAPFRAGWGAAKRTVGGAFEQIGETWAGERRLRR